MSGKCHCYWRTGPPRGPPGTDPARQSQAGPGPTPTLRVRSSGALQTTSLPRPSLSRTEENWAVRLDEEDSRTSVQGTTKDSPNLFSQMTQRKDKAKDVAPGPCLVGEWANQPFHPACPRADAHFLCRTVPSSPAPTVGVHTLSPQYSLVSQPWPAQAFSPEQQPPEQQPPPKSGEGTRELWHPLPSVPQG